MPKERTIKDVVEEHRILIGAERFHITPGPNVTPEDLAAELKRHRQTTARFEAFDPLERAEAQIARLRAALRRVTRMSTRALDAPKEVLDAKLSAIFEETDLVPDIDEAADIEWMETRRREAGRPLPLRPF